MSATTSSNTPSGLLFLSVHWDNKSEHLKDGFVAIENERDPQHEITVQISLDNALFAKKQESVLSRWISSAFFPPTYPITVEQTRKIQMTTRDFGILFPNQIINLPIQVQNINQRVKICFESLCFPNPCDSNGIDGPNSKLPTKCIRIEPSTYNQRPYLHVQLKEKDLKQNDDLERYRVKYFSYTQLPTAAEQAATMLSQGATTAQNVASTALSTSQAALITAAGASQNLAESVLNWLPTTDTVRDNCNIS